MPHRPFSDCADRFRRARALVTSRPGIGPCELAPFELAPWLLGLWYLGGIGLSNLRLTMQFLSLPAAFLQYACRAGVWMALTVTGLAFAQPPGTSPPKSAFESKPDSQQSLPVEAFLFLSEAETQVMMPSLTWEEFDRLRNLDTGVSAASQSFSYQSMEIRGSAVDNRAELEVSLRLTIESTGGRWVSIPLRMRNFHRLAPPDVSGVDEYFMALGPDDESGYLLFVKTNNQSTVTLRMRVSARIDRLASAQTLSFRLPNVPTTVELTTDADGMTGEVIGRGDETIELTDDTDGQTNLAIESGGGDFSVRWGRLSQSKDDLPLLEVESRVNVRWDSPQDQPLVSVQMTVRNVRGSIRSFPLRLPPGTVVLEPPRLGTSGQSIELGEASEDAPREVIIPEEEQQQRIDLNFDLQLANDEATASDPLLFQVPDIPGALRHSGEIEIETSGDYRLQWRSKAWIRSQLGESRGEGVSGRSYRFRYDRSSFELPLWLGVKERQLRISNQSQIVIREAMASLEMTISVNGQTTDGRLQFDDAGWQLNSIESTATGEQLQSFQAGKYRLIEFDPTTGEESEPIRIRAELPINADQNQLRFGIPRVMSVDDSVVVQNATVNIVSSGRTMLVVDLDASSGVTRVVPSTSELTSDSPTARFRVITQDAPAVVVGTLVDQLPRIALSSQSTVELDGRQLRTTIDWTVTSGLDLEGTLPVRIPSSGLQKRPDTVSSEAAESATNSNVEASQIDAATEWVVTVAGVRAELRPQGDERYKLISPGLASGSVAIRWQSTRNLPSQVSNGLIGSISLPRPDLTDVTLRGSQRLSLQGNQEFELVSADAPAGTRLELDSIPRDPVRVRLQSRVTSREELSIRQMMLRTAIGLATRHEQVLAEIQGGDQFRVELPETTGDLSVEALIDHVNPVPVRREGNTLQIALPGDKARHIVDLRVWIAAPTPSSFATIRPMLKLPIGSGRVYWQIIAPLDGHVLWASPSLGRSMTWRFDDWRLYREPTYSDQELRSMFAAAAEAIKPDNPLPPGNAYLYVGSDTRSFEVVVVSRVVLWLVIGSVVLLTAIVLTTWPQSRHPLTVVVAAVLFAGLLAIAPDAAVLSGQFGIIALVLVVVMMAIRVLLTPASGNRVFTTNRRVTESTPSTRSLRNPDSERVASTTQPLSPPTPSEASP